MADLQKFRNLCVVCAELGRKMGKMGGWEGVDPSLSAQNQSVKVFSYDS